MWIRKREGRWHYRFVAKGEEFTGNTGLEATKKNRREAERIAEDKQREITSARPRVNGKDIQMPEAAAQFINWCKVEYRSKPNTWERLKVSCTAAVQFWHSTAVSAITPAEIEGFKVHRAWQGVKDITIRHDLHALTVFFERYAMKQGWCSSNPVDSVKIPSDKDAMRMHVLSAEEEVKYFAVAHGFLADVGRLMLMQGCRPEEIMALEQDSIDLKAQTMRIKGGKTHAARRTLNLTEESCAIFTRRLKKPNRWVFPSPRVRDRHITKLQVSHDAACREAGVSFVLYDLRHTFATRQIEAGCDLPTLAAIMGHNGLRTIFRYVHPLAHSMKLAMDKYEAAAQRGKLRLIG